MSTVDNVIKTAKAQVGYHEGRSGGIWNNHQRYAPAVPGLEWAQDQPWCATFVSWVALVAGAGDLYPRTASCDQAAAWYKAKGRLSQYPAIGAQVFYGKPSDYVHTGIVYAYDDQYIYTVEGNTNNNGSREGDGVYTKKRARRDGYVAAYGYPEFPEGIKAADPKYAGQKAPKPAPKPVKVETPLERAQRSANHRAQMIAALRAKVANLLARLGSRH